MAQPPSKKAGSNLSNIMDVLRGNFDFTKKNTPEPKTEPVGKAELISTEQKSKLLAGGFRTLNAARSGSSTAGSIMSLVQSSLSRSGQERLENRRILQLMPEVKKAARLMIASIFSPNDLSRQNITVNFNCEDITTSEDMTRLNDMATDFFQNKLNLKTEAPKWVYQFGYEAGSAVFAVIPLTSFEKIQDESYVGTEALIQKVVDPICHDNVFGFGDAASASRQSADDVTALESFSALALERENTNKETISSLATKNLVTKFIAAESLNLTDNPSILQVTKISNDKRTKKTKDLLSQRYRAPKSDPILGISVSEGVEPIGDPILLKLPPESVTVIHTPGDPNDHQGYLVLLDHTGSPMNTVMQEEAIGRTTGANAQNSVFDQTFSAYGFSSQSAFGHGEIMSRVYTQIVSQHLKNRLDKAGFTHADFNNSHSIFRCMFSNLLQGKQTRILFLPKELVTYMSFELDQYGYGISKLDEIKFNLGMKMAVQVSKVLAAIKAAMDKRIINIKFSDNMMENPEAIINNVMREFTNKNTVSFSIDPTAIQSQIINKSVSIKTSDVPGLETFDITNDPDTRSVPVDFDSSVMEYLDKSILNGLDVPASTMNSLNEDEYARSVTTTNLFFSMSVSIYQDVVVKAISDVLKKYGRYSQPFIQKLKEAAPGIRDAVDVKESSSTDEGNASEGKNKNNAFTHYTIDSLLEKMSISLPTPNVAPSKAQFEAIGAMIESITNTMNAVFPDELVGTNDNLKPVVSMLRAKFTSLNIHAYLAGSGMHSLQVPGVSFSSEMEDINKLTSALINVSKMIEDQNKLGNTETPSDPNTIPGY